MLKEKKKINWNLISIFFVSSVIMLLGIILGLKISMSKVHADTFPNSSVTYNEYDWYEYENVNTFLPSLSYKIRLSFYGSTTNMKVVQIRTGYSANIYVYSSCTFNSPTLTCTKYYYGSGETVSTYNNTITINSSNVTFGDTTYNLVISGYTQSDLDTAYANGIAYVQAHPNDYGLYTTAQYNANYTAGQNAVLNNPNTYNLYTSTQYTNYGTNQYNLGYSAGSTAKENDILTNPNNYGLYSSAQYTAYGTSQYNDGIQYVLNNPNTYNLYTTAQYNAYGNNQYNSGVLAGQNDVINNPHNYNLYTTNEYNANYTAGQNAVLNDPHTYDLYTTNEYNTYGTNQYNAGYIAGLNDNNAYNLGIQHVINNPHDYNLYTQTDYNNYGSTKYNDGVQYVVNNPNEYNLYTTNEYNIYGIDQYNLGYQAGILQGENNVTSSPNDYNLYTQTQYDNNSSYSNFIENNIESVWINTPVYDSNLGYYQQHWQKINNTYITINNSTIDLTNIYTSGYTGITDIQIVLKNKFNGYTPLIIGNDSTNISNYQYAHVDLSCYNNTTANNRSNWEVCQVFGSDVQSAGNSLELDYTYLVNGENYFSVLENLGDIYINDYYNLKYNVITIGNYTYTGNTINVLDGHINSITFDLSTFNLDSYNLGYSSGYTSGQLQMQQAKYNEGYTDGYDRATELYENVGGNANTLVGLAGTILFSPVTMLKQIFNFEILGVNLSGFLLSIISLLIVAWLIKRLI